MTRFLILFAIATSILSCNQKPKINPEAAMDTVSVIDDRIKDTTKVIVASLPMKFDSTDVLLFTVGLIDLQERGYKNYGYSSNSNTDVSSGYYSGDMISGSFINIIFKGNNGNERKLTDKKINIYSVSFLRGIYKTTKTGFVLYSVTDRDSNGDKELTGADLKALYISKVDGTGFRKLTKELHQLYDWKDIKGENKIYFRTIEDKNGDGELNKKDNFHHYFINFDGDNYLVNEYNPLRIFE